MKYFSLTNGSVITGGEILQNKAVIVKNDKIVDLVDQCSLPHDIEKIDLGGNYLAPGFIDVQVNGAGGAFFGGAPTADGLGIMEKALLKEGTTGFLVTAATNKFEVYKQMIQYAHDHRKEALGNYLGLHLEGPYINPRSKGAHPVGLIKKATLDEVKALVELGDGEIRVMTMAPELQPEEVIRYLDAQGIVISIGHSAPTYDEAMHFLTGRKRMATHLYNGMQPMHHRYPGLIPAIFRARPFTGIVVDGIHVSYPMVRLAKQVLADSLMLVTDAVTTCKTGAYQHTLRNDHYVTVGADGKETISGSALSMLKAVQNCVEHVDISLAEAVNMASLYPAQSIGLADRIGQIKKGFDADFIVFDSNFQVCKVCLKGTFMC